MQPFSITLFATTGDPEGIRHLDKSNWSGYGVVFNKELFHLLKQEPGFSLAGIYILVGNAAEETIYIGEADPVGDRLKNHVSNKEGWVWGVYFFDRNHKIGKTEVQYLESALVALAKKYDRAILLNKNKPTAPTMAPAAKATHVAEIETIVPYNDTGKYMIKFKGPATAIVPIPRPEHSEVNMQSSRYALREKLLAAKNLDEVWA
ncbi:GIY-YIG nuclease family protein [Burkholderia pseudomallei]|nr:GIY-YIG nuclease family protein [Burkholderia pseudomallei]MBO2952229.1 GIY-YIG nuclease family protein [Burkholderia pseudomallei]MDI6017884.1 GIY-YIG nuclease family protein [Burkholderia pseudomallei]